jgi:hypothetical protein
VEKSCAGGRGGSSAGACPDQRPDRQMQGSGPYRCDMASATATVIAPSLRARTVAALARRGSAGPFRRDGQVPLSAAKRAARGAKRATLLQIRHGGHRTASLEKGVNAPLVLGSACAVAVAAEPASISGRVASAPA